MQDTLLHHVLVKRIPMLDQFARGMEAAGSDSLSPVSTHHIDVLVSEDTSDGIFGSTCLLRLNLTKDMGTMKFATFKAALEATFSSGRKAFTSVQSLVRVTCDKSN